ncbi:sugar transferase [Leadbetterella byssophila]|uniref:sugar transferase n=1 Tax=Leadbetterella byssophila TaxID=316068 RepID=UPI00399F83FC
MKHRYSSYIPLLNIAMDMFLLNLSYFLAYYYNYGELENVLSSPFSVLLGVFNGAWLVLAFVIKPYVFSRVQFSTSHLELRFLTLFCIHGAIVSLFITATQGYYFSRLHLILSYGVFFILGSTWRVLFVWGLKQYRLKGYNHRNYIVVGGTEKAESLTKYYELHPELGMNYRGYFGKNESSPLYQGSYQDVVKFIENQDIDYIYCYGGDLDTKVFKEIADAAIEQDTEVKLLPDYIDIPNKLDVEYHSYIPIFRYLPQTFYQTREAYLKRVFDILFSGSVLILGSPLFILIGIITKLTSPGPIIFKQKRTGLMGKPFTIYKFRSMKVDAEQRHSLGKSDDRITPWGHYMRRTRLDEIPQFINILKGDMSIVGPRPLAAYDIEVLKKEMPEGYRLLVSVKPGLTSIGQTVYGYASDATQIKERANIDLTYEPSLKEDLSIIFKTIKVVLAASGK